MPISDAAFMTRALELARAAEALGEVPVGAVLVRDDTLLGEGFNQPISARDPSAHAEVVALRAAARHVDNYRLPGSTLYVTIEPCAMCAGALVHARVSRLVFGAREPKAGAVCSHLRLLEAPSLNHRVEVLEGLLAADCAALISGFFQKRRSA